MALALAGSGLLAGCSGTAKSTPSVGGSAPSSAHRHIDRAYRHVDRSRVHRNLFGGNPVYDSIEVNGLGQTNSDIIALGFQCCTTDEFGDGLILSGAGGKHKTIEMIAVSWACQSGFYYQVTCQTTPHTSYAWPITMNVYAMTGYPSGTPAVGALLASRTQTFNIPYRPSANPAKCTGGISGSFIGYVDKQCDFGVAVPLQFNFTSFKLVLPQYVIVSVAFNTSDSGYNPVGEGTTCFTGPGGCGYDYLYMSAMGNGGSDSGIGQAVAPNGVFDAFGNPAFTCSGSGTGFGLDDGCWGGSHPEIEVETNL